jgi:uncharacterized metal-binding protein YceD (DUF177 family)
MNGQTAPFSQRFDLASLSEAGADIRLALSEEARVSIAQWAGVEAIDAFEADIRLSRLGPDSYAYTAHYKADLVQSCVVTLEPVRSHLEGDVERRFHIAAPVRRRSVTVEPSAADDDEVESLEGSIVDLAAPVLEEFSLGIDPYPRAPGVSFVPPEEPETAASPFAVLEQLKSRAAAPPPGKKRR